MINGITKNGEIHGKEDIALPARMGDRHVLPQKLCGWVPFAPRSHRLRDQNITAWEAVL